MLSGLHVKDTRDALGFLIPHLSVGPGPGFRERGGDLPSARWPWLNEPFLTCHVQARTTDAIKDPLGRSPEPSDEKHAYDTGVLAAHRVGDSPCAHGQVRIPGMRWEGLSDQRPWPVGPRGCPAACLLNSVLTSSSSPQDPSYTCW